MIGAPRPGAAVGRRLRRHPHRRAHGAGADDAADADRPRWSARPSARRSRSRARPAPADAGAGEDGVRADARRPRVDRGAARLSRQAAGSASVARVILGRAAARRDPDPHRLDPAVGPGEVRDRPQLDRLAGPGAAPAGGPAPASSARRSRAPGRRAAPARGTDPRGQLDVLELRAVGQVRRLDRSRRAGRAPATTQPRVASTRGSDGVTVVASARSSTTSSPAAHPRRTRATRSADRHGGRGASPATASVADTRPRGHAQRQRPRLVRRLEHAHRDAARPRVAGLDRQPHRRPAGGSPRRSAVAYWWSWTPSSSAVARYCSHEASSRIRLGGQQAHGYHGARAPSAWVVADRWLRRWSGFDVEERACRRATGPDSTPLKTVRSIWSAKRGSPVASSSRQPSMTLAIAAQVSA